ncbi:MAG: insulinase family protein, partial [Muribaculaceae bacterium]|nr:insulinase family protein [Muribaculaceae bacterium]
MKRLTSLATLLIMFAVAFAQMPQLTPLALKPEVKSGVLPNGLTYYILHNEQPKERANFYIAQKVGSTLETQEQLGLAHFLEHMAFGGSKHFPNRGAVAYLESLGMKYGIDVNAFTGHDRTIYMFAVPSDSLKHTGFAKPLSIIRDWMTDLTINPDRVETEKGIILEELRSTFQEDPFYDLKIGQNRFSSRMPLGTPDEVKSMTAVSYTQLPLPTNSRV